MPLASGPETRSTVLPSHLLVIIPEIWPGSEGKAAHAGGYSLMVSMGSAVLAEAGFESQRCDFLAPWPWWKLLSLPEFHFPRG